MTVVDEDELLEEEELEEDEGVCAFTKNFITIRYDNKLK